MTRSTLVTNTKYVKCINFYSEYTYVNKYKEVAKCSEACKIFIPFFLSSTKYS